MENFLREMIIYLITEISSHHLGFNLNRRLFVRFWICGDVGILFLLRTRIAPETIIADIRLRAYGKQLQEVNGVRDTIIRLIKIWAIVSIEMSLKKLSLVNYDK